MVLSVISDWKFTPTFMGNKSMVLTLHQLTGAEELKVGITNKNAETYLETVVINIENPIQLDFDGEIRDMVPGDIATVGALKDLYFEILVEYNNKTSMDEETVKN